MRSDSRPRRLDGVVEDLDAIVEECRTAASHAGLFASMYRSVTIQVHEAVRSGGFFDDDERLERLAVVFADRYIDAHRAFAAREPTTKSWRVAYDYALRPRGRMILQHLLLGMNAHINLDLGIAAAESADGTLGDLYSDFVRVNEILFAMLDMLEGRLGEVSPRIALLDRLGGPADEWFMRMGIRTARDLAWRFAMRLDDAGRRGRDRPIRERDEETARVGRLIATGWSPLHLAGRIIAAPEAGRVVAAIDIFSEGRANLDAVRERASAELSRPPVPDRPLMQRRGFRRRP